MSSTSATAAAPRSRSPASRTSGSTRTRRCTFPATISRCWSGCSYGAAYFFSRHPRALTINTPFVDAAVEGTEFLVRVEAERTLIIVFAGRVRASNPQGELTVANGESLVAEAGQAPSPYLVVRPRDAVQWTLFYPVDPAGAGRSFRGGGAKRCRSRCEAPSSWRRPEPTAGGVRALRGRFPRAIADADYYLYRAASAARRSAGSTRRGRTSARRCSAIRATAAPYALSAVIAVAQNDRERALEDARRARRAESALGGGEDRAVLRRAGALPRSRRRARRCSRRSTDEPENALAWARLSELWLMQGYRDRARKAAKKARELAPELARAQTVLGFAALAEIDTGRAKKAFRRAIAARLRQSAGRASAWASPPSAAATWRAGRKRDRDRRGARPGELAAAQLSRQGLLRRADHQSAHLLPASWSTNFPNQENTLAAEQFAIAKELDPNDPTPWLYDAIRLQSENRPVEALRNIEKSIELNDNRAVYRSRELLDQDRAARGTSLARIYNDLGFEQLGINEATKSLSLDPANAGAHRFLSDVYATQPRREIARVSELLQAQLLQDININPVQPSLSETNLSIFTAAGPHARASTSSRRCSSATRRS